MEISHDRAYFLFDYYCIHSTRIYIGGKIGGEEAASDGKITSVERELRTITIELFDPDGEQIWRRVIPLRDVSISLHLLGQRDFEEWAAHRWHSIMVLAFADGTTLFLAEPMVPAV